MRKISAVGLFCCDKFKETPKQKVIDLSLLKKITLAYTDISKLARKTTLPTTRMPIILVTVN